MKFVSVLLTVGLAASPRQDRFRIESLTVPSRLLPAGCRLAPDRTHGDPSFLMYPSLRQNPWTGTGVTATAIRRVLDGPPSDAGLTGPAGLTELENGVVGAYRARYHEAHGSAVEVYAVQFNDAALTAPAALARLGNRPGRTIVLADTAIRVSPGKGGDCFRAIVDYLISLRER